MELLSPDEACQSWGIVLTGGIGSGKSTIANLIQKLGYPVIRADELSRLIFVKGHQGYKKVLETFGPEILRPNQEIDRQKFRKIAFADQEKKQALESLTHPLIRLELARELEEKGILKAPRIWFYEAPVIIEAGGVDRFLGLWLVVCPTAIRYDRIRARDGMDHETAMVSLKAQLSDGEKQKYASYLISTHGTFEHTRYQVLHALETLKTLKLAPKV